MNGHRGENMMELAQILFPLHRSMTGLGNRQSLEALSGYGLDLQTVEVPSGEQVFDWRVPDEWSIRDAFIESADGVRRVDYRDSNLHVVNGSIGVDTEMPWEELRTHLHTCESRPDAIPYKTSYFHREWGFCLTQRQYESMLSRKDRLFRVCIDASYEKGSLTYGELILPGKCKEEILFWTHLCHPSLANDNLSGIAVAAELARTLASQHLQYTYRFVFAPATLGALCWLSNNRNIADRIYAGLVLTLLGNLEELHYKQSPSGEALVDRLMATLLGDKQSVSRYEPFGYDERQFGTLGFRLPIGRLTRGLPEVYAYYHSSDDNLAAMNAEQLDAALEFLLCFCNALENNKKYLATQQHGEPHLGSYGLRKSPGLLSNDDQQRVLFWMMHLCDGSMSLLDIAERTGYSITEIHEVAAMMQTVGLLSIARNDRSRSNSYMAKAIC
ncbi:MAG: DUF4910 domain-containing protein [Planctomycetota bacterium]